MYNDNDDDYDDYDDDDDDNDDDVMGCGVVWCDNVIIRYNNTHQEQMDSSSI